MRIFSSLKEAYNEIQRDLVEMGTEIHPSTMQDKDVSLDEGYLTKELQGYCYSITRHTNLEKEFKELGGNLKYAEQEVFDRVSQQYLNPGHAWEHRKEVWKEFLHDGRFSYTYNERYRTQLPFILNELQMRPNTRQAVVTMYDCHQDIGHLGGKERIPCSMYYQFLIRKRTSKEWLDIIYTMRSCDVFTHFLYDVYITMRVQEWIANSLGIDPGTFTHFIGSLHAYRKDYGKKGIF